jgi:hypothetical protein
MALAVMAVEHVFSVTVYWLEELLTELRRDADLSPARQEGREHGPARRRP